MLQIKIEIFYTHAYIRAYKIKEKKSALICLIFCHVLLMYTFKCMKQYLFFKLNFFQIINFENFY
jgi:hypothetical protein